MSKSTQTSSSDQPLRETEDAAYHAFREWPVQLVLRQKELEALLQGSSDPEPAGDDSEQTQEIPALTGSASKEIDNGKKADGRRKFSQD